MTCISSQNTITNNPAILKIQNVEACETRVVSLDSSFSIFRKKRLWFCPLFAVFLFILLLDREDGSSTVPRNVCELPEYSALHSTNNALKIPSIVCALHPGSLLVLVFASTCLTFLPNFITCAVGWEGIQRNESGEMWKSDVICFRAQPREHGERVLTIQLRLHSISLLCPSKLNGLRKNVMISPHNPIRFYESFSRNFVRKIHPV
jgi:hypothetical protein